MLSGAPRVQRSFGGFTCESAEMMRSLLIVPSSCSSRTTKRDLARPARLDQAIARFCGGRVSSQGTDGRLGAADRIGDLRGSTRSDLAARLGDGTHESLQAVVDLLESSTCLLPGAGGAWELLADFLGGVQQLLARALLDVGSGGDHALKRGEATLRARKAGFELIDAGEARRRLAAAVRGAGVVIVAVRHRTVHTLSAPGITAQCPVTCGRILTHDRRVYACAGGRIAAVVRTLVGVVALGRGVRLAGAVLAGGLAAGLQRVALDVARARNARSVRVQRFNLTGRAAAIARHGVVIVALLPALRLDDSVAAGAGEGCHEGTLSGARVSCGAIRASVVTLLAALDDSVAAGLDLTGRAAAVARQRIPIVALFAAIRVQVAVAAHVERAIVLAGVAVVGVSVVTLLPGFHDAIAAGRRRAAPALCEHGGVRVEDRGRIDRGRRRHHRRYSQVVEHVATLYVGEQRAGDRHVAAPERVRAARTSGIECRARRKRERARQGGAGDRPPHDPAAVRVRVDAGECQGTVGSEVSGAAEAPLAGRLHLDRDVLDDVERRGELGKATVPARSRAQVDLGGRDRDGAAISLQIQLAAVADVIGRVRVAASEEPAAEGDRARRGDRYRASAAAGLL